MVVAIDGPAGAGKSTIAKLLAERIGFDFLDTGAMYRALTWAALEQEIDMQDDKSIAGLIDTMNIQVDGDSTFVSGRDVSREIRSHRVTEAVANVADNPLVRRRMANWQREIAEKGRIVCEGRDQGSVVFPNAFCKVFLTASASERARRRRQQLLLQGHEFDLDQVQRDQQRRDERDASRPVGALVKAADAVEICTDGLTVVEVVDQLEELVLGKIALHESS